MGTTSEHAAVVAALNATLLGNRLSLPHGANGRPLGCSDPRATSLRRDIPQGKANPLGQLVTLLECDLRDGVPFSRAVAVLDELRAHCEVVAQTTRLHAMDRPIAVLVRKETKAQAKFDLSQYRVIEGIDEHALTDLIHGADEQAAATAEIKSWALKALATVRKSPRHVHGARRPSLVAS